MVKMGSKVKDSITGFKGTAIARTEYINGCVSICVETTDKDGKPFEVWFDEQRVDKKSKVDTGGPGPTPPKRSHG